MIASMLVGLLPALIGYQETVAERSNYKATSKSAEVVDFGRTLAERSSLVRLGEIGKTTEGRPIPLWIVADPPIADPAEAKKADKLVVLIIANIHAGEVDGKEAIGIYVRELLKESHPALLKDVVLLVVPNYNPDGNDAFSKTNRPGQVGPEEGMGKRSNGQGLDLNRDFVKLDAPETNGLLALIDAADPHVFMDLHTTNGSKHRYTLTYQGPLNPCGDQRIVEYVRSTYLPSVSRSMKRANGWDSFFYGNFEDDHRLWTSYPDWPRYGTNYVGMRNRISILSESYSYAPYKDRVLVTRDFVRECLAFAASHAGEIRKLTADARAKVVAAAPGTPVSIRSEAKPFADEVVALGFDDDGKTPRDRRVKHVQDFKSTKSVGRPWAYVISPKFPKAIDRLKRHGLTVERVREGVELEVHGWRTTAVERAPRAYEGHVLVKPTVEQVTMSTKIEPGAALVRTAQPLGNLAVFLLEPESDDNFATWGFFDDGPTPGSTFPVLRLEAKPARPIAND